ncbi:NAD-dependent epimerase/dehydratase family protein [Brevundimonas diminuta]|uniref:Epimerase n=2 Tax=Caulobacteraceae TaxID=76892 RepID=A0A246KN11_BREDI|nr:NAD-dependent epimerase/dehydratase family protein [Brevundimonas diminuta]OJU54889.1 MAG: epimerase [Brevundimonas sp. 67-6]ASD28374.1 epimerase [Brevundimonas diminuta]EGF94870.1 putative UDP-glucose 4-epimerase [Brevundimonas diminuta ATCC 11568]MBD3573377.1 NAD-dependent epimerase/dehydratase family protein [Brevundimonas diminuta]MBD3818016.1 NAD-dependent epimerase/dehydratase family protein [Brevundimonas diminuta]
MDKHILITGGAGFIGSHLVDAMLARGYRVTVLDSLSPQVHGDAEMDADGWPVYLDARARRIKGDLLEDGVFEAALNGVTHLAHLAASVGVGQSMTNIVDYTRNNVMAAAVMLETLSQRPHTVERIAVASSMSIYGEGDYVRPSTGAHVTTDIRPHAQLEARHWDLMVDGEPLEPCPTPEEKLLQPNSIYAVNKRDHEEMFLSVGRALRIPTVALRLFNAYGSRQALSNPYTGVAAIFISRLMNDQPPLVFEDGRQMRDFVHVQDVAEAFATVLDDDREIWDVFNVGSGAPVSINEIAGVLARLLGKNIAPEVLNRYRVGDIRHCFGDISKIERTFGFTPRRSMDEGMEELISWVSHTRAPIDRSAESLEQLSRGRLVV